MTIVKFEYTDPSKNEIFEYDNNESLKYFTLFKLNISFIISEQLSIINPFETTL